MGVMNITGLKAVVLSFLGVVLAAPVAANPFEGVDFKPIKNLIFEGESSKLNLSTAQDTTPVLHVVKSGLRAQSCRPILDVRRVQASLYVHVGFKESASGVTRRCSVLLEGQIPPHLSVSIHQHATIASLKGQFEAISIASSNSQVSLVGNADAFEMESGSAVATIEGTVGALEIDANQVVAAFQLSDLSKTRVLRIHAENVVADIGLPEGAKLEHNIRASISAFTSTFPLLPEAELALDIRSEIMSGRLYAF